MAGITVFTNAFLIDCTGAEPDRRRRRRRRGRAHQGRHPVGPGRARCPAGSTTLDLQGRTLMPGLTDAHVHICAVDGNITEQHRQLPAEPPRRQGAAAHGGVPDAGLHDGARRGRRGLRPPRGGRRAASTRGRACSCPAAYLSQTGGHGDKRRRAEWTEPVDCCVGMVGVIADGPDEVRRAAREQHPPRRRSDQDHGLGRRHVALRRARHHAVHGGGDAGGGGGSAGGRQVRPRARLLATPPVRNAHRGRRAVASSTAT